jgi:3-deoxy-7-phosphoheptulonate synthase
MQTYKTENPSLMKENDTLIFGPCSLESLEQITQVAKFCTEMGVSYMRTQLFKPRTSPYSFQGLGAAGIEILQTLRQTYAKESLRFVTEVCSIEQLAAIAPFTQVIQIGARNMQNFELLKNVGEYFNPTEHDFVLLKRGFANTVNEWLSSADYLIKSGVPKEKIILCERGLRMFGSPTGVSLDFLGAMDAKQMGYKVIIDPSHGSKDAKYVARLAVGSMHMGFDGIMVECHPEPRKSISDEKQALSIGEAREILNTLYPPVHHEQQWNHPEATSHTRSQFLV